MGAANGHELESSVDESTPLILNKDPDGIVVPFNQVDLYKRRRVHYNEAQKNRACHLLGLGIPCRSVAKVIGPPCSSSTPIRWRNAELRRKEAEAAHPPVNQPHQNGFQMAIQRALALTRADFERQEEQRQRQPQQPGQIRNPFMAQPVALPAQPQQPPQNGLPNEFTAAVGAALERGPQAAVAGPIRVPNLDFRNGLAAGAGAPLIPAGGQAERPLHPDFPGLHLHENIDPAAAGAPAPLNQDPIQVAATGVPAPTVLLQQAPFPATAGGAPTRLQQASNQNANA